MNGGKQIKVVIGLVFAGSTLVTVAACGSTDMRSSAVKAAPAADVGLISSSASPNASGEASDRMASLEKTATAAMNAVKGSTVLSVQSENGGQIWAVQLAGSDGTEQRLEVQESGMPIASPRVLDTGQEEKARVVGMTKDARITFKEAAEKVSASMPSGRIAHMSLDRYHDNALVWDVDVVMPDGTWHGLQVDAKDGTVTKKN